MLEIRFLRAGVKIGAETASTVKSARERINSGFQDADQATIIRIKPDGTTVHVEVQKIMTKTEL
jgi:hypothetical protein